MIREESIDVRGCLVMTLVRDCFGVTRSLSFSVSALELVSCDILPGAAPGEFAEVGLFVNAPEPLMFGNNAKRWLSRNGWGVESVGVRFESAMSWSDKFILV